jgi:hypothetical protein
LYSSEIRYISPAFFVFFRHSFHSLHSSNILCILLHFTIPSTLILFDWDSRCFLDTSPVACQSLWCGNRSLSRRCQFISITSLSVFS